MEIKKVTKAGTKDNVVFLVPTEKEIDNTFFNKDELSYIKAKIKDDNKIVTINRLSSIAFVVISSKDDDYKARQTARKNASKVVDIANENKLESITLISDLVISTDFIEGAILSNYQFLKYYSEKKKNSLQAINVIGKITKTQIEEVVNITYATNSAKDLVNEPQSFLNAEQLAKEIKRLGKESGFKVEVLGKAKIEALKMGGLLAVNKGSIDPPTFSVLEWNPAKAKNKNPVILVGKGVVYDTGGLSLKPTANSMDIMKCDMGGAAAVVGAMYAIAKNKLPFYVITLVPATDNRPSGNAYAPGDVITMHNKKTVEVLNTDAEGRMILADALSYAQKYKPELVLDAATLTGAAAAAIGHYGIVAMGNAEEKVMNKLKTAGNNVYERIVEFPFWDEYNEQLKSSIADLTNLGNGAGGSITAGKFLENFTDYPYIHLDIAGPAWMKSKVDYVSKGGSGSGVRVFYDFIKNY
ncbi:leucyl aminopeptidase [Vicingus serpentipes]|uniref:Leucyl aminopeptidase n=1 Tax=Vicingus serpentipes TaxID=1926625 RepID=A0A5C6RQZ7_9FLAO|nr:leucyl aminopeptidase [Vicingus serpentipes]TXB64771.1 leucyl aminopeptidase [Vicingus serpentipes]